MESIWVLEYRTRDRKNGRWSEWSSTENPERPTIAYRSFPDKEVFSQDKYEKRAVEYIRK